MTEVKIKVRVWDWTVRVGHWSLVGLVVAMVWTAREGHMVAHKWIGLALLTLLIYRLIWGVIGPKSARLLPLLPRPRAVLGYVRKLGQRPYVPALGHNPLGGLSVLALLGLLMFQVGSGLFAVDVDGMASGWFGRFVSFDAGRNIADLHGTSVRFLIAFILLHIVAITLYGILLRANLIGPMVTGDQKRTDVPEDYVPAQVPVVRFIIAVLIAAGAAWLVVSFGS
ncbi:MAG: cytochrome b/b6 domain-containing protein [Henriciella sp.]|nr:cytochrome b/b6 domain-containing protein [Henriciella sp.]